MDNKYTDITIILDRSGSMGPLRNDTIGGINTFLKDQKRLDGDRVILTLVQFANTSEVTIKRTDIAHVDPLTTEDYVTGGGTALLDAVGDAITSAGHRFASLRENARPGKVLFVIITDGEENSSSRYSNAQIKRMITEQQDIYKWQFVFLGANQDAFQSAQDFGIYSRNVSNYCATAMGTADLYNKMSANVASFRSAAPEVVQCRSFWQADVEGVDNSKRTGTASNP